MEIKRLIKRTRTMTFSFPEDVAAELDKQEKGKKSKIVTEALREYFGKERPPEKPQEIVKGMTEEEILRKVEEYAEEYKEDSAFGSLISKVITMKELQEIFGLPYMTIYNKILPLLRAEGWEIERSEG